MITEAQQTARLKWIEALESGRYEQGTGSLCTDEKYCCLGVACDVQGVRRTNQSDYYYFEVQEEYHFLHESRSDVIPIETFIDMFGENDRLLVTTLAIMNDRRGCSFNDIARYLRVLWAIPQEMVAA